MAVAAHIGKMDALLNHFNRVELVMEFDALARAITHGIGTAAQLYSVTPEMLTVHSDGGGLAPANVEAALMNGTKFFDAIYYFHNNAPASVVLQPPVGGLGTLSNVKDSVSKRLLWMAIWLMLRGSYPSGMIRTAGAGIPAFLINICGMNEVPDVTSAQLASFALTSIGTGWVRYIPWHTMAQPIRQRLSLGLAGYRMLAPFKCYAIRGGAPADVAAAFAWVVNLANQAPDYRILSATRDPLLIARLGSWNKALGNLILLSFSPADIADMVANKILYAMPIRDPRADTWRAWAPAGPLVLADPIGL